MVTRGKEPMKTFLKKIYSVVLPAETKSRGRRIAEAIVRSIGKPIERGITRLSAVLCMVSSPLLGVKVTARALENQQPIFVGATERLQYCYQLSQDQLVRDAMAATTSLINCTNGNNGLTPSNISERDFAQVNSTLLRNNAMKFTRGIEGEDRFGTGPIASSYLALAHTDLLEDLNGLAQFIPSHQYSNITPVMPAEAGYVSYFRVCLSAVGLIEQNAASNGSDVYDIFCVAREAVGDVEMSGMGVQLIYASPEVTEPRFRTASSLAVKWSQAPTILNDAWIIRLRATLAA